MSNFSLCLLFIFLYERIKAEHITSSRFRGSVTGAVTVFSGPRQYSYIVPATVTKVLIEAFGASGGTSYENRYRVGTGGGVGGYVSATCLVTPGQTLLVYAGGKGGSCSDSNPEVFEAGGFNGGGNGSTYKRFIDGSSSSYCAGGGGGASDVRVSPSLNDRIVVAGGGGGCGPILCRNGEGGARAGVGGGQSGGSATAFCISDDDGSALYSLNEAEGGTQSAGGKGGFACLTSSHENVGSYGQGGNGLIGGGGGGGGYYGGGGAWCLCAGGGSGFVSPRCSNSTFSNGRGSSGHGYVIITTLDGAPKTPTLTPTITPTVPPTHFDPSHIPDLWLWLDANDPKMLIQSIGDKITAWIDKIHSFRMTVPSQITPPKLITTQSYSDSAPTFSALRFTSTGSALFGSSEAFDQFPSFFIIYRFRNTTFTNSRATTLFSLGSDLSQNSGFITLEGHGSAGQVDKSYFRYREVEFDLGPIQYDKWTMLNYNYDSAATTISAYQDGALMGKRNIVQHGSIQSRLSLGSTWDTANSRPDSFSDSDIAEVLVYNRCLSDSERQRIEQYLNAKYSIIPTNSPDIESASSSSGLFSTGVMWGIVACSVCCCCGLTFFSMGVWYRDLERRRRPVIEGDIVACTTKEVKEIKMGVDEKDKGWTRGDAKDPTYPTHMHPERKVDKELEMKDFKAVSSEDIKLGVDEKEEATDRVYSEKKPERGRRRTRSVAVLSTVNSGEAGEVGEAKINSDLATAKRLFRLIKKHPDLLPGVKVRELIGRPTGQSVVFQGEWNARKVAIKMFFDDKAKNEISLLFSLTHENIMTVLTFYEVKTRIAVVFPFATGGTLSSLGMITEAWKLKSYFKGIAEGLQYLHSHDIVHLDIKGDNILLFGDVPKITDFGFAVNQKTSPYLKDCGTPYFIAPEVFNIIIDINKGIVNNTVVGDQTKVDVYAFGALIWEVLAGQPPFFREEREENWEMRDFAKKIGKEKRSPADMIDEDWLRDNRAVYAQLIKSCCLFVPAKRLAMKEVVQRLTAL